MAPERKRKDFIGFILASEKEEELSKEFLTIKNAEKLLSFFKREGFTRIDEPACKDILKSKTKKNATTQHQLSPKQPGEAPVPCPPNAHY